MDYWLCESGNNTGSPHVWEYRVPPTGRPGTYLCKMCLARATKPALKESTDA